MPFPWIAAILIFLVAFGLLSFPILAAVVQHGSLIMITVIVVLIYYVFIKGKR